MAVAISEVKIAHDELASMTECLIGEYETVAPAGSVIRLVARTVHDLRHNGVAAPRLAELAEPLVRGQLNARGVGVRDAG